MPYDQIFLPIEPIIIPIELKIKDPKKCKDKNIVKSYKILVQ